VVAGKAASLAGFAVIHGNFASLAGFAVIHGNPASLARFVMIRRKATSLARFVALLDRFCVRDILLPRLRARLDWLDSHGSSSDPPQLGLGESTAVARAGLFAP
jgi:hypothetical protein